MVEYGTSVEDALGAVISGRNVFVTGAGGTGKTHFIKTVQSLYSGSTLTVAPTGVAALNVDGVTAHRAIGLSMGVSTESDTQNIKAKVKKLLKSKALERIIIDEASMFRADKLWEMDIKCQVARKSKEPFGGLQVIMVGDFFQNPPVLTNEEEEVYYTFHDTDLCCFSKSWESLDLYPVLLEKSYRQSSVHFASVLNCIRRGERVDEVVKFMNSHCYKHGASLEAITLTSTNSLADRINKKHFDALKAPSRKYYATKKGEFPQRPVPEIMELKEGLRIMITTNDPTAEDRPPAYVNGSRGVIKKLLTESIVVKLDDGEEVSVGKHEWENVEYIPRKVQRGNKTVDELEKIVIGSYVAFPIRLGYAVTIHKAQGLTLPELNIDFGYGAFSPGMAYVAFSRATTARGLRLLRPVKESDIIVDKRVVQFYEQTFPQK